MGEKFLFAGSLGKVYPYEYVGGSTEFRVMPVIEGDFGEQGFGSSLATSCSSDVLVVGSKGNTTLLGHAYVYYCSYGSVLQVCEKVQRIDPPSNFSNTNNTQLFGFQVAIVGSRVFVSDPNFNQGIGAVHAYICSAQGCVYNQTIFSPNKTLPSFGASISATDLSLTVSGDGFVAVYDLEYNLGSIWYAPNNSIAYGSSVSSFFHVGLPGVVIAVSDTDFNSPQPGIVFIYQCNLNLTHCWLVQNITGQVASGRFGSSVSISSTSLLSISAPGDGVGKVFVYSSPLPVVNYTLIDSIVATGVHQVSINEAGQLVIGAEGNSTVDGFVAIQIINNPNRGWYWALYPNPDYAEWCLINGYCNPTDTSVSYGAKVGGIVFAIGATLVLLIFFGLWTTWGMRSGGQVN